MIKINNTRFDNKYFPNNEVVYSEVKLSSEYNVIRFFWESNADIGSLLMAVQYIRENTPAETKLYLEMPYIPYSAMDRWINDQVPSAIYFANIINSLDFDRVYVLDPHSEVVMNQLGLGNAELIEMSIQGIIEKVIAEVKPDFIYYPDKGAYAKYPNIIDTFGIPYFHGYKHRDLANKGQLSPEMKVDLCGISLEDLKDSRVLIIDDICRKGGTAYYAAKNLHAMGVLDVYLYVSHCEPVIVAGNILTTPEIDKVYCTESEYGITKHEKGHPKLCILTWETEIPSPEIDEDMEG